MGLISWLIQRFSNTEEAEETDELENLKPGNATPFKSKNAIVSNRNNSEVSAFLNNQEFLYGMLFGSVKTDLDNIKQKLHSMHSDMSENHNVLHEKTLTNHQEVLGILGENRKQLGQLIGEAEDRLKQPGLPVPLKKDIKQNIKLFKLSLRQAEVFQIAKQNTKVTAKQVSKQLRIAENTATEHLRNLEKLGSLSREKRGVYRIN